MCALNIGHVRVSTLVDSHNIIQPSRHGNDKTRPQHNNNEYKGHSTDGSKVIPISEITANINNDYTRLETVRGQYTHSNSWCRDFKMLNLMAA